jgi:hypothetical protein
VRGLGVLQFGVGSGLQHSASLLMRMSLVSALQTTKPTLCMPTGYLAPHTV